MFAKLSYLRPAAAAALAFSLAACGGGNPFQPSSIRDGGVTLTGTVLGGFSSSAAGVSAFAASDEHAFTVSVKEDPSVSVDVGADGVFTLRGLPDGGFTLLFTSPGGEPGDLGELSFDAVMPNQEITIAVTVDPELGVSLVEESRNGIGHGDIEIQGNIGSIGENDEGETLFEIGGYPVVAIPGQTAVRRGNTSLGFDELGVGDQVHVKGVFRELRDGQDPADQEVLALEIKLQREAEEVDEDDDGGSGGDQQVTICHKGKNTLTISINAWPAHQAHGDTMGACRG